MKLSFKLTMAVMLLSTSIPALADNATINQAGTQHYLSQEVFSTQENSTLSNANNILAYTSNNANNLLSKSDVDYVFTQGDVQAISLTTQEMLDTQGAVLPLAYYGAVYGVPATMALSRWASTPSPQIWYHKIRQKF